LKKFAAFGFFYSIALTAFADQCPNPNEVVVYRDARYVVNTPPGWQLISVKSIDGLVDFNIAAWGDHTKDTDYVRCYYYTKGAAGSVELRSEQIYAESSIKYHANWSNYDSYYHLCSSTNVGDCIFG
jgi:hypothetical protein